MEKQNFKRQPELARNPCSNNNNKSICYRNRSGICMVNYNKWLNLFHDLLKTNHRHRITNKYYD